MVAARRSRVTPASPLPLGNNVSTQRMFSTQGAPAGTARWRRRRHPRLPSLCAPMDTFVIRPLVAPVEVRDAGPGKGRGVFATAPIARGTIIEVVPVIVLSLENYSLHGQYTELAHYTFCWPGGGQAVALGLTGSMWNHRSPPNVGFVRDAALRTITFSAVEPIALGEECCIDYGRHLWFDTGGEAAVGVGARDTLDEDESDFLARVVVASDNGENAATNAEAL